MHTSVCNTINYFFDNDISCNRDPIEVSYVNNTQIKIYKPNTQKCYVLTLSEDSKKVIKSEYTKINDESCKGNPIGLVEWDDNNQYYQKIGGYDKVREIAIKVYKEGILNTWEFDQSHIAERGGNPVEYSNYVLNINMFYSGVTGKNVIQSDTTKEYFNKMVESYYYIMK